MSEERMSSNIILENRRKISISGVTDVDSFDDTSLNLVTSAGMLIIKGSDIKIEKLNVDTGEIIANGDFYSAEYTSDEASRGGLFSRIFR